MKGRGGRRWSGEEEYSRARRRIFTLESRGGRSRALVEDLPFDEKFQCDPIESGLELILRGLEFLCENPTPRRRKHAILNFSAGAEALLRERLRQEHWSQVFQDPARATREAFERGLLPAAGLMDCLLRLEGVCGVEVPAFWRWGIESLARRKSLLELRGFVESTPVLVCIALAAARPFVDSVPPGRLTPSLAAILDAVRGKLTRLEGQVTEALRRIGTQHAGASLLNCPNCRLEGTLIVRGGPKCLFCGYSGRPEDLAAEYALDFFPDEDRFIYRCPACDRDALLDVGSPDEDPWYVCFACSRSWELGRLAFCAWCDQPFEPPEGSPDEEYCPACRRGSREP